jgi:hypothetical protein
MPSPWPARPGVLTFSLDGKLAYAPVGSTYDVRCIIPLRLSCLSHHIQDTLDNVVSAFPALGDVDRARISLHVPVRDVMVRVPACAWTEVLVDFPRYKTVMIEIEDDLPPEYPSKGKSKASAEPAKRKSGLGWLKTLFGNKA